MLRTTRNQQSETRQTLADLIIDQKRFGLAASQKLEQSLKDVQKGIIDLKNVPVC